MTKASDQKEIPGPIYKPAVAMATEFSDVYLTSIVIGPIVVIEQLLQERQAILL